MIFLNYNILVKKIMIEQIKYGMFHCKTIKDYLAIYLKCDVLILADII